MGYSSDMSGELLFTAELTAPQLATLQSLLNCEVPWPNLRLNENFNGLVPDQQEAKNYSTKEAIISIIEEMRLQWPSFGLRGRLDFLGEDGDRWSIFVDPEDGVMEFEGDKVADEFFNEFVKLAELAASVAHAENIRVGVLNLAKKYKVLLDD